MIQFEQYYNSNMSQLRQGHRCQIDCTNHEEVINGLELKSKDLYFFWVTLAKPSATINGFMHDMNNPCFRALPNRKDRRRWSRKS